MVPFYIREKRRPTGMKSHHSNRQADFTQLMPAHLAQGNIHQGGHIHGQPRIFARFRKGTEIKAVLWVHLDSLQIQAKSSDPPNSLAEHCDRQQCLPVATTCLKTQNHRMYIVFQLGSICLPLGSRKHQEIIFKALIQALIKIPLLVILSLSACWKNSEHLPPFCRWESHSKQLHYSNNITGQLWADMSVVILCLIIKSTVSGQWFQTEQNQTDALQSGCSKVLSNVRKISIFP